MEKQETKLIDEKKISWEIKCDKCGSTISGTDDRDAWVSASPTCPKCKHETGNIKNTFYKKVEHLDWEN